MPLRLVLDNEKQLPDGGPISISVATGGGIEIGRAQYLDWVLPDPNKVVSNKHCEVRWQGDGFYLTDTSTNGTYLNGGESRLNGSVKLKDGDRIAIGHYIVAVMLQDEAPASTPGFAAPATGLPKAAGLDDLWSDADAAPPISADLLRPRPKPDPNNDFMNRVADLPWNGPVSPVAAPTAPASLARDTAGDDDWLPRETSRSAEIAAPPTAPVMPEPQPEPIPAPREEVMPLAFAPPPPPAPQAPPPMPAEAAWDPSPAVAAPTRGLPDGEAEARAAARWVEPGSAPTPMPPQRAPAGDVLARFAKGAGIPPAALASREAGEFAEELGRVMRAVANELKHMLDARQQAKRTLKVSHHTEIAALDNNPLKYQPSVEHALTLMLGKPDRTYMGAQACIEASLRDVAEHQLLTFSAMQKAIQMLEKELEPSAIEKDVEHDKGLAARVGFRHSRLWDAYVHRWADRTKYHGDGLTGAFLRDFAKCYDELESSGH